MSKYKEQFESRVPQNRFLFDYLTINFRNSTPSEVLQIFCGLVSNSDVCPSAFVEFDTGALTSYNRSLRFFGERYITINWRNFSEGMEFVFEHTGEVDNFDLRQGVSLNITGTGCRVMTEQDFYDLFDLLKDKDVSYTRVDVAFDDFNGLMPSSKMLDVVFDWFSGNDNLISTRVRRTSSRFYINNAFIDGGYVSGSNFDFGSNGSSQKLRFYDKKVEQSCFDVDYWKRLEFTLRHDKAVSFVNDYLYYKNIVVCYVKYLSNILRFVDENSSCVTRKDIKTASWWEQFLQDLEEYKLLSIYI